LAAAVLFVFCWGSNVKTVLLGDLEVIIVEFVVKVIGLVVVVVKFAIIRRDVHR